MKTVIKVENISKIYNLGEVGTGTISRDIDAWWAKVRGKENPNQKINEVRKSGEYEYHQALDNVSFEVKEGDVLGIIGKNGAGKSTLLKILSRVTSPSSGQFKVRGRIASLLEVGTGFHPELTGRENVFLNGAILGMRKSEIKSKFDEIIEFSGVEKFIDTPVKRYSSGMYVRLAFAVAAHLEPEILIVDEVLAVGDMDFQKKCLGKMKDVSEHGRTVLFVSHNMNAMQQLCNKGVLISKGKVLNEGPIAEVINQYIGLSKGASSSDHNTTRRGSSLAVFTDYYLSNGNGDRIESITMGDDIYINCTVRKNSDVNYMNMAFTIRNSMGEGICHVQNMDANYTIPISSKEVSLRVKLNSILFVPGTYFMSIWIGTEGGPFDNIDNCMYFDVINNASFNRLQYPHNVKVFINSSWKEIT